MISVSRDCLPLSAAYEHAHHRLRSLLAGMHVVMHFSLSVAWFQLIIIAPLLAMMPRCTGVAMMGV